MNHFNRLTSRNDWIVLVFLRKQAIINESKNSICELLFFREHDDYKFFRSQQSRFFCTHNLTKRFINAMNTDETICCENMFDNVFCVLSRCEIWYEKYDINFFVQKFSVTIHFRSCEMWFERYDTNFFMQKLFVTIRSRDLIWSFYDQRFDCLISSEKMTYARSWLVERRMYLWWGDSDDRISSNSSNCERLIKSDESDS